MKKIKITDRMRLDWLESEGYMFFSGGVKIWVWGQPIGKAEKIRQTIDAEITRKRKRRK